MPPFSNRPFPQVLSGLSDPLLLGWLGATRGWGQGGTTPTTVLPAKGVRLKPTHAMSTSMLDVRWSFAERACTPELHSWRGWPLPFFFRFRMPPFGRNRSVPRAIIFEVFAHAPRVSRRASLSNAPFLRVPFAFARLLRPRRSSRGPAWRVSDVGRPWHVCVGFVS